MSKPLNIAFFGSSLVSAYWNGAATYYRGIIRALAERGHRITFYEPDAFERQEHRDIDDPPWARVVVYPAPPTGAPRTAEHGVRQALERARGADLIVKASGVGVFDELLEAAVPELGGPGTMTVFWDVDAPATLDRLHADADDPFHALIPRYDLVLTYGGGEPVARAYEECGARRCVPIYNALDSHTHHPVPPVERFAADLSFLGNRLPDREARVERFFFEAARRCPDQRFLLGGSGWDAGALPVNVRHAGHVYTRDHNAFNCSPRAVLNISRQSMADYGFSPATRVFEAAGAGACLITDYWEGVELFLEPGEEVLVAHDGDEVADHLRGLTPKRAAAIGEAARRRVLAEHTYAHRAEQVERVIAEAGGQKSEVRGQGSESNGSPIRASQIKNQKSKIKNLNITVLGLSITSSWGNGHATTYRSLLRAMARRGHRVRFLERDVPWYAAQRDMPNPPFAETELYADLDELKDRYTEAVRSADAVIVGSYVPDGVEVGRWVTNTARGATAFYDIDTPVTLAKLARRDHEYLHPELIPRYDLYLSFTGGPTLERIEREYGSPRARPLYCCVDPELYYPRNENENDSEHEWDLGYMGTYSDDRQPRVEELLIEPAHRWKGGRFAVAGPQYPDAIDWPANVERIDHLPPAEHRAFYNRQRFTLNITRDDMIRAGFSPSVRLFEAAACATPIISDRWEGLSELFSPDEEILIADRPERVLHWLTAMPEHERRAIGEAARRRVLAEHTADHRAAELEEYLREAMGGNVVGGLGRGRGANVKPVAKH